jgi:hypothetical protein
MDALKAKIEKADQTADAFAEKLGEMEQLFTGMHSQRLILDTLKSTAEEERKEEALAVVDEIKVLYDIAEKHNNQRIVSFLAATLSLVYMYAKQWDAAVRYGEMSIQCNPRRWDDRLYNLACVHAMKFQATKDDAARQSAVSLLRRYFEQKGVANVAARDLAEALLDDELGPIVDEIKALILEYRKHYEVTGLLAKTFAVHKRAPDKDAALALLRYCLESSGDGRDDIQQELMGEEFKPLRSEIDAILLNWPARQA